MFSGIGIVRSFDRRGLCLRSLSATQIVYGRTVIRQARQRTGGDHQLSLLCGKRTNHRGILGSSWLGKTSPGSSAPAGAWMLAHAPESGLHLAEIERHGFATIDLLDAVIDVGDQLLATPQQVHRVSEKRCIRFSLAEPRSPLVGPRDCEPGEHPVVAFIERVEHTAVTDCRRGDQRVEQAETVREMELGELVKCRLAFRP